MPDEMTTTSNFGADKEPEPGGPVPPEDVGEGEEAGPPDQSESGPAQPESDETPDSEPSGV